MKNQIDPAFLPCYIEIAEEIRYAGINLQDIASATLELGYTQHTDMTNMEDTSVFDPNGSVFKVKPVALLEVTLTNGKTRKIPIDRPVHYTNNPASIIDSTLVEEQA